MWYDHNLPSAVEAFVYVGEGYPQEKLDRLREVHRAFLKAYGLTTAEVPLLDYQGWAPALEPASKPAGKAFVDVS